MRRILLALASRNGEISSRRLGLVVFYCILGVAGLTTVLLKVVGVIAPVPDDMWAPLVTSYSFGPLYQIVAGAEMFILVYGIRIPADGASWVGTIGWQMAIVFSVMFNAIPLAALAGWCTSYFHRLRS